MDTIALSPDGEWLFYGPLAGSSLWRVPTVALRDPGLDEDAVAARVERWSDKPTTDGAVMGPDGTLYLTAPELDGIALVRPGRSLALRAQDRELLAWPDGLALSPDGQWLYVTASAPPMPVDPRPNRGRSGPPTAPQALVRTCVAASGARVWAAP